MSDMGKVTNTPSAIGQREETPLRERPERSPVADSGLQRQQDEEAGAEIEGGTVSLDGCQGKDMDNHEVNTEETARDSGLGERNSLGNDGEHEDVMMRSDEDPVPDPDTASEILSEEDEDSSPVSTASTTAATAAAAAGRRPPKQPGRKPAKKSAKKPDTGQHRQDGDRITSQDTHKAKPVSSFTEKGGSFMFEIRPPHPYDLISSLQYKMSEWVRGYLAAEKFEDDKEGFMMAGRCHQYQALLDSMGHVDSVALVRPEFEGSVGLSVNRSATFTDRLYRRQ